MAGFNQLTLAQEERLSLLLEELGESVQAIGKILRHGYASFNPTIENGPTNRESLEDELGDVVMAMRMMIAADDLCDDNIEDRAALKAVKVREYLHHRQPFISPRREGA